MQIYTVRIGPNNWAEWHQTWAARNKTANYKDETVAGAIDFYAWSVFMMHWPAVVTYALVGKE